MFFVLFFFNDTATTEIYTLSLHDALPIWRARLRHRDHQIGLDRVLGGQPSPDVDAGGVHRRSEEHTSELQSHLNLVCRLLLEKKNTSNTDDAQFSTIRLDTRSDLFRGPI